MGANWSSCNDPGPESCKKTAAAKIFDTARELFYRRGIRAVGVDEIVCEAGVTKPSLYRAFKSKDDLVVACLAESAREGREAIIAAINEAGDNPRDQLSALVAHYAQKMQVADFRGCPMSNVAVELSEPGHPGRIIVEDCKTELRGLIANIARRLPIDDPIALADGLLLIIEGAISTHHVFGSQGPAVAFVPTCNALIEAHMSRAFQ